MKTAFRIVLVLTLLPVTLALAGLLLSNIAGCSGMAHIEHCDMQSLHATVSLLIAFFWISVFVVPVGAMVLVLLGVIMLLRGKRGA